MQLVGAEAQGQPESFLLAASIQRAVGTVSTSWRGKGSVTLPPGRRWNGVGWRLAKRAVTKIDASKRIKSNQNHVSSHYPEMAPMNNFGVFSSRAFSTYMCNVCIFKLIVCIFSIIISISLFRTAAGFHRKKWKGLEAGSGRRESTDPPPSPAPWGLGGPAGGLWGLSLVEIQQSE